MSDGKPDAQGAPEPAEPKARNWGKLVGVCLGISVACTVAAALLLTLGANNQAVIWCSYGCAALTSVIGIAFGDKMTVLMGNNLIVSMLVLQSLAG